MKQIYVFFEKNSRLNLLLFVCSFYIYFFYFEHIFLNLNSVLSSITADTLKNYYTFVYHTKNDPDFLTFTGMNYPYGEHIIYTDCQPLLTFILRLFPFTHSYLVGIMHGLIFFSFIVTPLILNKILRLLGIDKFSSFFISLAIALLSPQFLKINAGHFALAYGCLIPLSLLFTLSYLKTKSGKNFWILFSFNTLLFLIHPYLGFCLCLFSFLSLELFELLNFNKSAFVKRSILFSLAGLLPLVLFKLFMLVTDKHLNRTTEPYGAEVMVENTDSLLAPVYGPFQKLMEYFFHNRPGHYEGHTYLGFFTILLAIAFVIYLISAFKKLQIKKEMLVMLIASFVFLLVAFGVHLKVLELFHLSSPALNQFRAVCRFAWIFYFTLPLFLISTLYQSLKNHLKAERFTKVTMSLALLFFCFNMLEANSYFHLDEDVFWKDRNFFHEDHLNLEEKIMLKSIAESRPQAILPLPLFHGGSEMYDRLGSNNSMIPSMIYSYHSKTPILSVLMSRTSLTETKDLIQLLNSYKKDKAAEKLLSSKDLFVITTNDPLLPDETRLLKHISQFAKNDSLQFGYLSLRTLFAPKMDKIVYTIPGEKIHAADSANFVFVPFENRKPFLVSKISDYETIFVLDSNKMRSGSYIVSFHYHYKENTYKDVASNLILNRSNASGANWDYDIPVRLLSGFYQGFAVFEYKIDLKKENKYEFILKGNVDATYKISDFMLRPETTSLISITAAKDTAINNFPR